MQIILRYLLFARPCHPEPVFYTHGNFVSNEISVYSLQVPNNSLQKITPKEPFFRDGEFTKSMLDTAWQSVKVDAKHFHKRMFFQIL
jgi:hypothetical protein